MTELTGSVMQKHVPLVEAFHSPQGEGYNAGRDAVFIRFAGCPLACIFADGAVCDTPYQTAHMKPTLSELVYEVIPGLFAYDWGGVWESEGTPLEDRPMIVLTGGEPTMSPMFDPLVELLDNLHYYIAVETNGTHWRDGLELVDWICVSPKDEVQQGSQAPDHNHNPQSPELDVLVMDLMWKRSDEQGEYRHVISPHSPVPPMRAAFRHYLSPAMLADGSGREWLTGFPGFVPGALERCLEIQHMVPLAGWRISTQQHKIWGVR